MNQQVTTPKDDKSLATVARGLFAVGLNLATAVPVRALDTKIWIETAAVDSGTILLLGNGGQGFWQLLQKDWPTSEHPVDDYSARVSDAVLQSCLPAVARRRLFPDDNCPLVLQRLMTDVGWHARSPLGMGMHTEYGLWNACRAVWWLDMEVEAEVSPELATDHCFTCVEKPCVTVCPANSLSASSAPLLSRCADYRLTADSDCAQTCLAREACPVALEHRYKAEQLSYHYELARSAIVRYRSSHTKRESD